MSTALVWLAYLRGYFLAMLDTSDVFDGFEALRDRPDEALAFLLGVEAKREGQLELRTEIEAHIVGLTGPLLAAPPLEAPQSPPVARERLTLWSPADNDGMARVASRTGTTRMIAWSDGHWEARATDGGSLTTGCATLGTFTTLLAAAQHAADSSAEARERYEWEGQKPNPIKAPVCHNCGAPEKPHEALAIDWDDNGRATHFHEGGCPPAAPTQDHIADAGEKVAPTRAEVEAALGRWMETKTHLSQWAWLGWKTDELLKYDDSGVIPARPLKVHAEKPPTQPAHDAFPDPRAGIWTGVTRPSPEAFVAAITALPLQDQPGNTSAPVTSHPPGWPIIQDASGTRCDACGARQAFSESVIQFVFAHEHCGLKRSRPVPPAVHVPRPGEVREEAIRALVECEHLSENSIDLGHVQGVIFSLACTACGSLFRYPMSERRGGWELPRLLANAVKT